MKKIFQ
jgi:hypothetical protein